MADAQEVEGREELSVSGTREPGIHSDHITQAILNSKEMAPAPGLLAFQAAPGAFPDWYLKARKIDRDELKDLFGRRWLLQGKLDKLINKLQQDIRNFAEPLLLKALKDNLKVELDVRTAELRLYVPNKLIFGISTGANHFKQLTLLDAALHNFEASEADAGAFSDGSGVFTRDAEGAPLRHAMTVEQFVTLCRSLDIGAQYQTHLKAILTPAEATARVELQKQSVASDKAAFKLAALVALLKGDITSYGFGKMLQVHDGAPNRDLYGAPMHCHRLSLMGFRLTGIVLFSAVSDPTLLKQAIDELTPPLLKTWLDWSQWLPVLPGQDYERFKLLKAFFANGPKGVSEELLRKDDIYQQSRVTGKLIAYVPDDPEHPIREYDSFTDFMKTLIGQLLSPDYQQFFSRFVAQDDKGVFFRRVNERLKTFTWKQREPLDMGPWWRETAVENPNPEPITNFIDGNLWSALFTQRRDKALADTRRIAVPTGDEDAQSRWKRLASYLDIGWNIFNFAAMLVPGLGEAMLGIMVAQLLEELAEGLEDWSKGDRDEASAHLTSVLINSAQLALMGAGHVLPSGLPTPIKASPFVDSLKAVELPDGKASLWKPDLAPYERTLTLPEASRPDQLGLHRHEGLKVLPLDNKHYALKEDPNTGRHRIEHPTRPNAYQPELAHNGAGAWSTELEDPMAWDAARVWQRLGHSMDEFSAATQARIRTVIGVDDNVLRRLHVEHESPPPLLTDTIKRFKAYAEAEDLGRQILDNRVAEPLEGFLPTFVTELPGWPQTRAVALFEDESAAGPSITYGNVDAPAQQTIRITRTQLRNGKLAERVVDSLEESEILAMLGQRVSSVRSERLEALRARLAMHAGRQTRRLFDSLTRTAEAAAGPRQLLLQRDYPQLSGNVARDLLRQSTPEDLRFIDEKSRLPLGIEQQARGAMAQLRVVRAYEGLYLEELRNTDTERLALHSIAGLPGWSSRVRIEVRELSFSGALRDSVGPPDAPIRKVLVVDEEGLYEARDALDLHLHGADDLYGALLHALPDTERKALGYEINQKVQLKATVLNKPLPHDALQPILAQNPVRKPPYDPRTMRLKGGMQGYPQQVESTITRGRLKLRVRRLYPTLLDVGVEELLESYVQIGGSAEVCLIHLEREFNAFNTQFQRWIDSPTEHWRLLPEGVQEVTERNRIYQTLKQCWQRTGPAHYDGAGRYLGQSLNLRGISLPRHLRTMPLLEGNFDHVTELNLRDTGLTNAEEFFLKPFRRVRLLNLEENRLTRLPLRIGKLRQLTELSVTRNRIVLGADDVGRLKQLTRLHTLGLGSNPLGRLPDISRMPDLHTLILADTGAKTWPPGLFEPRRPRHFYMELQLNKLTKIPAVEPGSASAELIARSVISREPEWISADNLEIVKGYIRSMGMDPDRPFPPRGVRDSIDWEQGLSRSEWARKQLTWNAVEDEFHSLRFFEELRQLTRSADYTASLDYRANLTRKVWRMLDAMAENSALRERLFAMATLPTACVDGGTALFNAMGVEVLIHEAYALGNEGLIEAELVSLARGKSRLDELRAIASHSISERMQAGEALRQVDADGDVIGTIDEVEVHLAYMTDLAERLELPWQARGMQFRRMAGVTRAMIDDAYQRIEALEKGELLTDWVLQQEFWKTWLEEVNADDFKGLERKVEAITEFWTALDERAQLQDLDGPEALSLEQQLKVLATELGKPAEDIAPGRVMSEDEYSAELAEIADEQKALFKRLTRQAIDRAKLQRVEIPFTVEPTPMPDEPEINTRL
ncbi:hypothetical protein HKK52_17345 [Pseudomonas sp. ADAK2]|uniref:dermonecrotic toxin domain-containing protein n=1 Tax=unclassified Pseudomonas TaxID=196821 RepID=UPI001463DECD|nr:MULTISPECIES: DUF6543 domain-containing protein [unclassified Pseudomonas]QJI42627.1 hypothetical protein HKK53_17350 [Pseudomonas sp. ADAK7]QJI48930.1 hypothetical protein HKK52_17345 [Pseudomonas sp. ADAK2]